jgi:hypothetical protein
MCLNDCLEKGACVTTLRISDFQDFVEEPGGLVLRLRSFDKTQFRSHYKGDSDWTNNNDGTYTLTEYHKIEVICLQELQNNGRCLDHLLINKCRKELSNSEIPASLIRGRFKSLIRNQLVFRYSSGYGLTKKGKETLLKVLIKRYKAEKAPTPAQLAIIKKTQDQIKKLEDQSKRMDNEQINNFRKRTALDKTLIKLLTD